MVDTPKQDMEQELDELEQLRQREADTAWSLARACLRTAARTGLPRSNEQLEIARELESVAEWLRMAGQPAVSAAQSRSPVLTVQIRRWRRRSNVPLQLQLERRLWDALDQPARLQLTIEGSQIRLYRASESEGRAVQIRVAGPQLSYTDGELPLGTGTYAAEVREGAIVIGARLDGEDQNK